MKRKTGAAVFISIMLAAALALAACELGGAEAPKKNLVLPYISVHPQSSSFYTDAYTAPELSVEVWDWISGDGNLSYQWYKFTDIAEYCENGGEEIAGATQTTYKPDISDPGAGDKFYYYVIVTNTNDEALGDVKSAAIQSEVAAIAFSAPGDPLVPIITKNPANASYGWGRALNALRVEARIPKIADAANPDILVTAPGVISYQWYSNDSANIEEGTLVPASDKASFIPGYDILKINKNYFYAVVTNTTNTGLPTEKKAFAVSIPAIIDMQPGQKAAAPRISKQPADRLFFNSDTVTPLSVTAASPDMGDLSYQWFSNTTAINSGGTAISGATNAVYTPPKSDGFYYVVVTNTNVNVTTDATTATLASRAVQVRIADPGAADAAEDVTVTIPDFYTNSKYLRQYVRGYGGMHVAWDNFPALFAVDTELMYNPDKMGYNILRIMIRPDNVDIKQTMDNMVEGSLSDFYKDYYENVKIVNKYGGYVAASPWTPPKEWKSNNSINGGGNLIPGYYRLFANYLRTFAQLMYDKGAPIYCISISNEPNYVAGYDGCEWSNEEMRDFWLEIGHFTDGVRGYGGGKELPYVLTMNGESANTPYINKEALENPKSRAVIDLLARHIYGSRKDSLYNSNTYNPNLLRRPDGTLTEVWMTEHNINSANPTGYYNDSTWNYVWRYLNDVDLVMRINNENAFVWWASKRFYSMVSDGQFGTPIPSETQAYPLPRGWMLTHYARYTTDTTRIHLPDGILGDVQGVTGTLPDGGGAITNIERATSRVNNTADDMDNLCPRITAYVSQDGNEISVILWTPTKTGGEGGNSLGTVKINLPEGFLVNGVKAHRSWGDRDSELFQPDNDTVISADRKSAYVSVPRSQILSVKFTK